MYTVRHICNVITSTIAANNLPPTVPKIKLLRCFQNDIWSPAAPHPLYCKLSLFLLDTDLHPLSESKLVLYQYCWYSTS